MFGLVLDGLLSARVVTADGQVLDVSETQNSDLFWGLRGAGFNLGVVTSATYQAHKLVAGGQVMNADFIFPANMSKQYFDVLASFSGTMPSNLAVVTIIFYDATAQAVSSRSIRSDMILHFAHVPRLTPTLKTQILANWVYIGPKEEGLRVIAPVTALKASSVNIQEVPWSEEIATAGAGINARLCQKNLSHNAYSANLRNLSSSTFQATFAKMADFYAKYPDARSTTILIETFPNQAMAAVPDDATAYPWRDAIGYM